MHNKLIPFKEGPFSLSERAWEKGGGGSAPSQSQAGFIRERLPPGADRAPLTFHPKQKFPTAHNPKPMQARGHAADCHLRYPPPSPLGWLIVSLFRVQVVSRGRVAPGWRWGDGGGLGGWEATSPHAAATKGSGEVVKERAQSRGARAGRKRSGWAAPAAAPVAAAARSSGGAGSGRDAPRDTQRKGSAAACCRPRRG